MGPKRVELFAAIRFDWQRNQMPVRALARKYDVHRREVARSHWAASSALRARSAVSASDNGRAPLIRSFSNWSRVTAIALAPG